MHAASIVRGRRARHRDDPSGRARTEPYPVAKATGMIKLDAMENPFALPPALRERLARRASPTCRSTAIRTARRCGEGGACARRSRCPNGAALVLGNGSDELLQLLTTVVAAAGRRASLRPSRRSCMYRLNAHLRQRALRRRPAARGLLARRRRDARGDRARAAGARLARVSQQPDRQSLRRGATIERILAAAPGLVVVDEAYYAFADDVVPAARARLSPTSSSCARCPRSAWPGCGWATRSRIPPGSTRSTRCGRRTTSMR